MKKYVLSLTSPIALALGLLACGAGSQAPTPVPPVPIKITVHTAFPSGATTSNAVDITYAATPTTGSNIFEVSYSINEGAPEYIYLKGGEGISPKGALGTARVLLVPGENSIVFTAKDTGDNTATYAIPNKPSYDFGSLPEIDENFVADSSDGSGSKFVTNRIIAFAKAHATDAQVKEAVAAVGASIAGQINLLRMYSIQLPYAQSEAYLESYCATLKATYPNIIEDAVLDTIGNKEPFPVGEEPFAIGDGSIAPLAGSQYFSLYSAASPTNDPYWTPDGWALWAIDAPAAWEKHKGAFVDVKLGIVDGGAVRGTHEDLGIPAPNIFGRGFADGNHASHVIGTIGMIHNNNRGLAGVIDISRKSLYGYDSFDSARGGSEAAGLAGLAWAVANGAKAVNFSLGYSSGYMLHPGPTNNAMRQLLGQGYDFLVVQSAGNESIDARGGRVFPSTLDADLRERVVTVGAADSSGTMAWFSNWGINVDVVAPGVRILSPIAMNDIFYTYYSGTSMAAPHVTGVAGLVFAANPGLTGPEVKYIIAESAKAANNAIIDPRPSTPNMPYFMLNAKTAVDMAIANMPNFPARQVLLNKGSLSLFAGEIEALIASVLPGYASNKLVSWHSSNSSVASIDANGLVTAHVPGAATMTVTTLDGGHTASCNVVVSAAPIAVTEILLNKEAMPLMAGQSEALFATVLPEDATNRGVIWTSSNSSVASVNASGLVTAHIEGSATITARTAEGGRTAQCIVTVAPSAAPVASVTLNIGVMSLVAGSRDLLIPTVLPENAANKSVTWSSNLPLVASVDEQGLVTAHAEGTAIITVTTVDGNRTAQCTITVTAANVPVAGVILDKSAIALTAGAQETLIATVLPDNATNKGVTWLSNNSNVASVNAYGTVTAHTAGTASITVMTEDGNRTAQCVVTVTPAGISVTGVTLNKNAMSLEAGNSELLTPTVLPPDATIKAVAWSSNNPAVASVDSQGLVTAHTTGTASITVMTEDGNRTAQCIVTVTPSTAPVESVSLNKTAMSLVVRGHEQEALTATVLPAYAANKAVNWSSNNPEVASVDGQGLVTAKFAGTAVVTVTTVEGNHTAQCIVTATGAAVTGVAMNKTTASILEGGMEQLTATVLPANATIKAVAWSSNAPSIASVDANGMVHAHAIGGTARITATAQDGGATAHCDVTVQAPPRITAHPQPQTVTAGRVATFTATATGGPAPTYQWQMSASSGASWQDIPGARSASYSSFSLTLSDNGKLYRAIATNAVGSAISDAATLTVIPGTASDWMAISAGSDDSGASANSHTAALRADGTLWTWGTNRSYQLGIGLTFAERANQNTPGQVGVDSDWVAISSGRLHMQALKISGARFGWGYNMDGRVGTATTTTYMAPYAMGGAWASISAGGWFTVGLRTNGTLWAWGDRNYLGASLPSYQTAPRQVGTDSDWAAISAGEFHTLALKTDGTLWAWGRNSSGQLGIVGSNDQVTPIQVRTDKDWAAISAGSAHSMALKSDGSLWAWGSSSRLGIGDSTLIYHTFPVQVGTDTNWQAVSAGGSHTVALKSDGTLWAWGANESGQLGDGTTTNRRTPVQVVGSATNWTAVAVSRNHTVAMRADGTLWAWGANESGQLGDGTYTNQNTPVQIK